MHAKTTPAILVLVGCALAANARIGETLPQLEKRYGRPVSVTTNAGGATAAFTNGPYHVTVYLWRGVCHMETVSRADLAPIDWDIGIEIVSRIGGTTNWTVAVPCYSQDGRLQIEHDPLGVCLHVWVVASQRYITPAFRDRRRRQTAADIASF